MESNYGIPLVLKDIDVNRFYEIKPNDFTLSPVYVHKITVEECPNCTYFEGSSTFKVALCDECKTKINEKRQNKKASN